MPARRRPLRQPRPGRFALHLEGFTHGGEAVGRLPDGKACFVPYAIPGERVVVVVVEERKRWARGRLVELLEASPDRVDPPCPYFGPERCGGCALQHIAPDRQRELKRRVVIEQLERIGGLPGPPVAECVAVGPLGYRSQARFAVDEAGRLGFRRAGTHDIEAIDRCLLLDEPTQALREEAGDRWHGVEEVTVRTGAGGTACLAVTPGAGGVPPLPEGAVPVALLGPAGRAVALRGNPTLQIEIGDLAWSVSPGSFFQPGPEGAAELLRLVREAAAVARGDRVLELFGGVGLFTRGLVEDGAAVTTVESGPSAAADARDNLVDLPATVVEDDAEAAVAELVSASEAFDVVVLDPPRRGAGEALCRQLAHLGSRSVVYVSCDPAALARDARALTGEGLRLERVVPVDQFTQTAQVEMVASFLRG